MKRIVSTLIPAVLAMPALAAPTDDAAIGHVIEQHYNRPLAAEKCQLSDPPKGSQNLRNTAYCMKRAAGHTVTRNGKTTRYELYTGFAYDLEEKRINDSHASSGLAEVFVLEKEGGKWAIKLHGKDEVGAWGKTPDAEDWRFMQVGGQNWGYAVETAYTGQGSTVTGLFCCSATTATVSPTATFRLVWTTGLITEIAQYTKGGSGAIAKKWKPLWTQMFRLTAA